MNKTAKGKQSINITLEQSQQYFINKKNYEEALSSSRKKSTVTKKDMIQFLDEQNISYKKSANKSDIQKVYDNPEYISIEIEKTNILSRLSTMQYEAVKDYIDKHYEVNQPKFTAADKEEKIKIWNLRNEKGDIISAFNKNKSNINKGDHIYGIREGFKFKKNIIGSNSLWNMVPCGQADNVTWKNIEDKEGNKKNLVYDDFTDEEIKNFDEITKDKYDRLQNGENIVKAVVQNYFGKMD